MNIILSPIEKIHIISGIKKKIVNKQNVYTPIVVSKKLVINLNLDLNQCIKLFQKVLQ